MNDTVLAELETRVHDQNFSEYDEIQKVVANKKRFQYY